ncbi:VanZ family protein [Sphingobacterium oryzagri]|uniref:VanZ family protein n=1 Tax=Sphingobacterium oryzagri TaxID=3025669 RepID=A0ABY7WG68_9SPHI|nr:VanZ family protein [Sphingobacterium sp. KACC 22765]WDF68617.1 VanZ family protein [Sphingobacterium sp. KACC 22765]
MLRFLINYAWAIIWGLLMLLLMGLPSDDLPNTNYFVGFDKLAHCGFFFVFTVLLLKGSIMQSKGRGSKVKTFAIVLLVTSSLAFGTEAIQLYFSFGRMADWWDIFADYMGIGMALLSYILLHQKRQGY